ncbi:KpsF/GutQ family sugar-phosphate isomerase [Rhizobium sp. WL3]|uniref:KpsF/GutQ family sugar-phosphate isomerase n=1 Tax=Rhizobium sp. WL3 TaxID=2603277 RepID=UPI00164FF858|nr:KpsF/GutQ family sugar-phosphate isomerase [Rhizobium sp. WL3]
MTASDADKAGALLEVAKGVLAVEAEGLLKGSARIDSQFLKAVALILGSCPPGRVVVMGVGKSGHIAHKIAATLASTGTPAFFVHPTEAGHGDLGMITRDDVVLAISYSGKSDELLRVVPYFKRHGIMIIALTGDGSSPLAQHADIWLDGSVGREACPMGLAPTASTTLALALGDALAVCLLHERGFTSQDFALTHPHGTLGRRLLVTIEDIMLKGADIPKVGPGTTIRNCLTEMTRGGIGVVGVVEEADEKVVGIFTDGDLRRSLDSNCDIFSTTVAKNMTRAPLTMKAAQLAAEAADVMERHKVNAILVTDAVGRLEGALNMRILLRAGVV